MSNNKEIVKKLVTENPQWYEDNLLSTIIRNEKFYKQITKDVVCSECDDFKTKYKDFTSPVDNIIYGFIEKFYETNKEKENERGVSQSWLSTLLLAYKNAGNLLANEYNIAVGKLDKYYSTDTTAFESMIKDGFEFWLNARRSAQLVAEFNNQESPLELLKEKTTQEIKRIKSLDNTSFSFGGETSSILKDDSELEGEEFKNRYPLPGELSAAAQKLGGIAKKEGALFTIPSGGGKTVLACQLASGFAVESSANVLLFTTEQPPEELVPRIVSCRTNIPFNLIMDGVFASKLNSQQKEAILNLEETLAPRLKIIDWSNRDKTIEEHLTKELDAKIDEGFIPDIIIFDWIGGGLAATKYRKTEDYRNAFLHTGDNFTTILKQYNLAGVAFAQADSTQSENVTYITSKHTSIGKQLHISFSLAVGVSALMNAVTNKGASGAGEEVYKPIQVWNPYKVRKGTPKSFRMKREFGYQRWVDAPIGITN